MPRSKNKNSSKEKSINENWLVRIKGLIDYVVTGRERNWILCITGGLLAAFSFPNPFWIDLNWKGGFLAFICLIPLFAVQEPRGLKFSFRWGFLYGFVYFGISLIWMAGMKSMYPLGPLAWLLLISYLAIYPACFLSGYHALLDRGVPRLSAAVTLWLVLEFARNYVITGFPWVALGYAHYQNRLLMALAPVTGVWGLTFITVLVNGLLYLVLSKKVILLRGQEARSEQNEPKSWIKNRDRVWGLAVVLLLILAGTIYEQVLLQRSPGKRPVNVGVLQGSVNQDQPWDQTYVDTTFAVYNTLLQKAALQKAKLVVWPETVFPGIFNYDQSLARVVREWSRQWNVAQLVGADEIKISDPEEGYEYYNSLILLNSEGKIRGRTSKVHLVPFGEYVPYKDSILFFVHKLVRRYGGAGFSPGKKRVVLPWKSDDQIIPVGGLICFESLFPQYAADLCKQGSELLVISTYDTWFGNSAAPANHAIFSMFRAAENGRFVLRAAANGISMVVDPKGRCLGTIGLNEVDTLVEEIRPRNHVTLYTRFGNWICWICIIMLCFDFLPFLQKRITRTGSGVGKKLLSRLRR